MIRRGNGVKKPDAMFMAQFVDYCPSSIGYRSFT